MRSVSVTILDLDDGQADVLVREQAGTLLSATERRRAVALANPTDRRRFLAAHVALRHIIKAAGGALPPGQEFERSSHGKPYLATGPAFSLSGSNCLALVALSSEGTIGIDIERIRPVTVPTNWQTRHRGLAEILTQPCPPSDGSHLFLRAWTRLEAVAKRDDMPMKLLLDQSLPQLGQRSRIRELDIAADYLAALACWDDQSVSVRRLDWSELRDPHLTRPPA